MIELAGILDSRICWLSFLSPFSAAGDAHLPIVFSLSLSSQHPWPGVTCASRCQARVNLHERRLFLTGLLALPTRGVLGTNFPNRKAGSKRNDYDYQLLI